MPDPLDDAIAQLRTARQVAEQFGITSQQLRRLAKLRSVGHRIGSVQVFTPADVAALTERRPGRRSTFELKGFKDES
jgi:hypothetical protein